MSMRYVSLKALQRSHSARSETLDSNWQSPMLNDDGGLLSSKQVVRPDPERLAQILGATTKTNQYGDYLSVRCWCAQPPRYSPDCRALKLLLPEAVGEIVDPRHRTGLRKPCDIGGGIHLCVCHGYPRDVDHLFQSRARTQAALNRFFFQTSRAYLWICRIDSSSVAGNL
jgi:hypothetical protein